MDDDPMLLLGVRKKHPLRIAEHLEGTWVGEGVGEYPPHVARFPFVQELVVEKAMPHKGSRSPDQQTWMFRSHSWHKETHEGLHSEYGFLRFTALALDHGRVELTCTSPSGLCEIDEGTYTEDSLDVWTRYGGLSRPQTATRPYVTEIRRQMELRPQNQPLSMEYRVEMATERTAMQLHYMSKLRKQPPSDVTASPAAS
mmetsp:Transcript_67315/g.161395  ORF Transcript_67315/g.161395 Transcript_67315/m.161395 type:complete len:199 (-) Transcript_67315:32-628(-)